MTLLTATVPLLEVHGLCFQRQNKYLFGPLDFRIHAGELALIEGTNGSGKTTLVRILAGLLHTRHGQIRNRCHDDMLYLGHHLAMNAVLSIRENLHLAIGLYGQRTTATIETALDRVGLHGYADQPIYRLSAGQRKRGALARLLLLPATLWLLDEPQSHLDHHGIELLKCLIREHLDLGGSALLTTHGEDIWCTSTLPFIRVRLCNRHH